MTSIALLFPARISVRKRLPAVAAAFKRAGLASAGMASQAWVVTMVAPISGHHLMFVMWGAKANHWKDRADSGVVSKELIRPVCRFGKMSVVDKGTGEKPADFQRFIVSVSSPQTKNFIFRKSSGVRTVS